MTMNLAAAILITELPVRQERTAKLDGIQQAVGDAMQSFEIKNSQW